MPSNIILHVVTCYILLLQGTKLDNLALLKNQNRCFNRGDPKEIFLKFASAGECFGVVSLLKKSHRKICLISQYLTMPNYSRKDQALVENCLFQFFLDLYGRHCGNQLQK